MEHRIIPRSDWKPRYSNGLVTSGAKTMEIVHHDGHTRSLADMSIDKERALLRFYEDFHVHGDTPNSFKGLTGKNPRIAYSHVIMQSGRIYEACGFGRIGAHTEGHNSSAYATFFPLNGAVTAPTEEAIEAFQWLRLEGIRLGHLSAHHIVKGHQDFNKPACPGKLVYDAVVLGCAPINPGDDSNGTPDPVAARPTLRLGKGGAQASADERAVVAELQRLLIKAGALPAKLESGSAADTGFFGTVTDTAVRKFQQEHKLNDDGIVGKDTWDALT